MRQWRAGRRACQGWRSFTTRRFQHELRKEEVESEDLVFTARMKIVLATLGVSTMIGVPSLYYHSQRQEDDITILHRVFTEGGSEVDGTVYMNREQFIRAVSGMGQEGEAPLINPSGKPIFDGLFSGENCLINFSDFVMLDSLYCTKRLDLGTAFQIFDKDRDGSVSRDEFQCIVKSICRLGSRVVFDVSSPFWVRFFGENGEKKLSFEEFDAFIVSLKLGMATLEYNTLDQDRTGKITAGEWAASISSHEHNANNLSPLLSLQGLPLYVSYDDYLAFDAILTKSKKLKQIIEVYTAGKGNRINREEFYDIISRLDVPINDVQKNVMFTLFSNPHRNEYLLDVKALLNALEQRQVRRITKATEKEAVDQVLAFSVTFMRGVESFAVGGLAGAIGGAVVYPIDLVKTRLQNQRTVKYHNVVKAANAIQYTGSFDCAAQVLRNEGMIGFYRGLGPQLVGVAPEKAIKLVMNDLLRKLFRNKDDGELFLPLEILAGCGAGFSQVIVTNPLEIVKIRLQVQGENKGAVRKSALHIVRELGLRGLYKGSSACLIRDVPFSGIYFPLFAQLKVYYGEEPLNVLLAGTLAGICASSLTTPADVIKTRLQVEARPGELKYAGLWDCGTSIVKHEGFGALFKGIGPRVLRLAPQFGITLFSYDFFKSLLGLQEEGSSSAPTNAPVAPVLKTIDLSRENRDGKF